MAKNLNYRRLITVAITTIGTLGAFMLIPNSANADSSGGNPMWSQSSASQYVTGASRVIRLAYSGSANGTLLGTFESSNLTNGPDSYVIQKSTDDGRDWTTLSTVPDGETGGTHPYSKAWQPALFEYPTAMSGYPAGTLMLVGNFVEGAANPLNDISSNFEEWRSTNDGASWSYVGVIQRGGPDGSGVWEPFITSNGSTIQLYFSDERQSSTYSQFIGHIVSTDGGTTWSANADGSTRVAPGEIKDVASASQGDRPGMPTIAIEGNGNRVMAYECPGYCEAHYKISTDGGTTWGSGPTDMGTVAVTNDGWTISRAPYITWSPAGGPNGTLLLTALSSGYNNGAMLSNTNGGVGSWGWVIRPFSAGTNSSSTCNTNYSGAILPSANGLYDRVVASVPFGPGGSCEIGTDAAPIGALPYYADLSTGRDRAWLNYDTNSGCWAVSANVYSDSCAVNGDLTLSGNSQWTDYTMQADVKLASTSGSSMAGVDVRLTHPGIGPTQQNDYFAGVTGSQIVFGRHAQNWTQLATATIPGGLAAGSWYHLSVQASGCTFAIQGLPVGSSAAPTTINYTDAGCTQTAGAIGLQVYGGTNASWRNVSVTPGAAPAASPGFYLAPWAAAATTNWSSYGGTWTTNSSAETLSVTSGSGYKGIYNPSSSWGDYTVESEVSLANTSGNAGLLVRATNPTVGADSVDGYYIGLTSTGIVIGKESYGYTPLAAATLPGGIAANTEFHMTVVAKGCAITATAVSLSNPTDEVQTSATDCTYATGAVGLRTYNTAATWRQFTASAI